MKPRPGRNLAILLLLWIGLLCGAAGAAGSVSADTADHIVLLFVALLVFACVVAYLWINRRRMERQARELTRLAENLGHSEHRYRTLVERVPAVIYTLDAEGTLASLNPAFEQITGWPAADWIGRPFGDLLHPEDVPQALQVFHRVLQGEQPSPYVVRVQRKTGGYLAAEVTPSPRMENGRVIGSLGLAHDISERQRAEETLRKSEEHYRSLVENIKDMYYVSDREGRLTYGSPNLFAMTGYDPKEMIGRSYTRLIAREDRRRVVDFYLQRVADGTVDTTCAFRARNRAGENAWVEQATRIIRDAQGEVTEYRNLVRDIRERKQAEERIHMLAQAIRSTGECVSITDRDNHILFVNDAFLRTYGYEGQELMGRHISVVRAPNSTDDDDDDPVLRATLDGGWRGELLNHRKDGSEFPISLSTSVVRNERGEPIAIIGVARDITARKEAEARATAFSMLGQRLSAATTAKEAARIIVGSADDLLGWDACALALYVPERDAVEFLLSMDIVDGQRREVTLRSADERPGSNFRRVIGKGPELILREHPALAPAELIPFGDVTRPSMSLLFAPIHDRSNVTGVLTIQSYTARAYNEDDLATLQALADHCCGALNRIRAEQERREAEERYRSIFENAVEGVYRSSPDRRFITANPAVAQILGYDSPQELIDSVTDIRAQIVVDSVGASAEFRRQLDTHEIVHGLETQFYRKDGSKIWVSCNARPTCDAAGNLLFYDCFLEDIAERKQAQVHSAAFTELGKLLSAATTAAEASRLIKQSAHALLGWDACTIDLYDRDQDLLYPLLYIDTIDGRHVDFPSQFVRAKPGPRDRRVIDHGAQLILRQDPEAESREAIRFGDVNRASASLMFAPITNGAIVSGVISVQSYTLNAYDADDLGTLQALADHCGGALNRLRAEQALRESEDRYRSIVEGTQALLFSTDVHGRLTYVNEAAARALGCPAQQLLGSFYLRLVHPDDRERVHAVFTQQISGANPVSYEEFRYSLNGQEGWLSFLVNPILDGGKVVGLTGVSQDITARKRAEQAAEQEFTRINLLNEITRAIAERQDMPTIFRVVLQHLEDHMPVDFGGIYLYDADTDQLTVAARGPRSRDIAHLLGRPEGVTLPVGETGLRACLQGETRYIADLAKADLPQARELARHGIHATVAVPLRIDDKAFGVLGVARREVNGFSPEDVEFLRMLSDHVALAACQARLHTELQNAYDELRQTQQAVMQQERLRALGQMASGIAHDINNALSPVLGFTELLLATEPALSERTRRYLQNIRTASSDMAHIVARMREFYRARDARASLAGVDLNELAQQVIDLTTPRWHDIPLERGLVIDLRAVLDPTVPIIQGVEAEIREALTNLIFNAVDALPRGGAITVRTLARCQLSSGRIDTVVVQVADTGGGMDEETRRRCLEPFYSTKGERGTGLGLAMVYGVMQRHEGDIEIESQLGTGTLVGLVFPARMATATTQRADGGGATTIGSLSILAVDDEPSLRELLREMLAADGHRVATVENGRLALQALREARARNEPFDLVITDLGMPDMDGRQVARSVKREAPDTPVIMITGWGARLHAEGDIPAEVDVVLGKPPRLAELRSALAEAAARRK